MKTVFVLLLAILCFGCGGYSSPNSGLAGWDCPRRCGNYACQPASRWFGIHLDGCLVDLLLQRKILFIKLIL